jgi:hypothetical protein
MLKYLIILTLVVTPAYAAKKTHHKASKASSCGTFMYHKGGKCVDARVTPPKT